MKYSKVSIMIPTYNQEAFIEDAINSAITQDYPNLEIIVGDDCSTDRTGEIAIKYISDNRVKYFRNEKNLGRVGNYHHIAHNLATGEWAINLDGDDYFTSSTFISDAMKILSTNMAKEKHIVAYCYKHPIDRIQKEFEVERVNDNTILMSGKDYFLGYYKIKSFGHPNIIFNLTEGKAIELYTLPYQACDFHSLMRLFLMGNIMLDNREVSHWRIHGGNTTLLESEDKQQQAMLTFDALEDFAKNYCSKEDLILWRKHMNSSSYQDYVSTYVYTHKNAKALLLLISHPKISRAYLGQWKHFLFENTK